MGGGGAESKKAGVFAWEKNVAEMNGKGTCPRLLVKKKKKRKENEIRADREKSCRNTGGEKSGGA